MATVVCVCVCVGQINTSPYRNMLANIYSSLNFVFTWTHWDFFVRAGDCVKLFKVTRHAINASTLAD